MQFRRAVSAFVAAAREHRVEDANAILRGTLLLHAAQRVTPDVFEDDEQYLQVVCAAIDDANHR
jgi:hypothetical protein